MAGIGIPRRGAALALCLAASPGGAGCYSPLARSVDEQSLQRSGDYAIVTGLDVPPTRGPDGCGAQALATVLACADPDLGADALAEALPWHDEGATPVDLLLAARDHGFEAKISHGSWAEIARHAGQGVPVLVMVDAAPEFRLPLFHIPFPRRMHWSVVSGVAADGSQVLLAARGRRHHVVGRDDFLKRWSRSANCTIHVTRPPPRPEIRPPPA